MEENEALQILCNEKEKVGTIDGVKIAIAPGDIRHNLRVNDFVLDLEYIQDLCSVDNRGNYEIFQGHSLAEVKLNV